MMKKLIYVLLIVAVGAASGWAGNISSEMGKDNAGQVMEQSGDINGKIQRMTRMMEDRGFKSDTIEAARNMVMTTGKEGLPADPVANKAFEGLAKRVPEQAIIQAMEKTRARYALAYQHVRQFGFSKQISGDIGNAVAECMAAGLAEKEMEQVMTQLRNRVKTASHVRNKELVEQSVLAVRTMARMGLSSERTGELVCLALEHQYNDQDMMNLQIRFREQARTQAAAMVANSYAHAIADGVGSNNLGRASWSGNAGYGGGKGVAGSGSSGSGSGSGSGGGSGSGAGSGSGGRGGGGRSH